MTDAAGRSALPALLLALNPSASAADPKPELSRRVPLSLIWKSAVGNSGSEGEGGVERGGWSERKEG